MKKDNNYGEPKSGLHGLFVVFLSIAISLLAIATALVVLNWLDDFLHAPIGIKDYPPEPGFVILFAKLSFIPLVLSVLLLGFLSLMSRIFNTVPLLLGTAIITFGGVSLVGGILGEHKGEELFHGQAYFSQTVTPILYILFLMSCVGIGANHCIVKWKSDRKPRYGIAGLCLLLSISMALIGFLAISQNDDSLSLFIVYGILMVMLGFIVYHDFRRNQNVLHLDDLTPAQTRISAGPGPGSQAGSVAREQA
jgi:hypothetical protein